MAKPRQKHWLHHIDRQAGSDLTIAEYCDREGLSAGSFSYNKCHLKKQGLLRDSSSTVDFVPLEVISGSAAEALIEIVSPGGTVIRLPASVRDDTLRVAIREAGRC